MPTKVKPKKGLKEKKLKTLKKAYEINSSEPDKTAKSFNFLKDLMKYFRITEKDLEKGLELRTASKKKKIPKKVTPTIH